MKILTLNTWQQHGPWRERWDLILTELRQLSPDMIGFQEIFDAAWVRELENELPEYTCYYPESESGLAIFSRIKPAHCNHRVFRTQSDSEDKRRYVIAVTVAVNGSQLTMLNTHLSWRPDESHVREKQILELKEYYVSLSSDSTVLAVGDFNAVSDSPEIKIMSSDAGFEDLAAEAAGSDVTWSHKNPYVFEERNLCDGKPLPERRIDYVFGVRLEKAALKKKAASVVFSQGSSSNVWPSDHFGVLVELERNQ